MQLRNFTLGVPNRLACFLRPYPAVLQPIASTLRSWQLCSELFKSLGELSQRETRSAAMTWEDVGMGFSKAAKLPCFGWDCFKQWITNIHLINVLYNLEILTIICIVHSCVYLMYITGSQYYSILWCYVLGSIRESIILESWQGLQGHFCVKQTSFRDHMTQQKKVKRKPPQGWYVWHFHMTVKQCKTYEPQQQSSHCATSTEAKEQQVGGDSYLLWGSQDPHPAPRDGRSAK